MIVERVGNKRKSGGAGGLDYLPPSTKLSNGVVLVSVPEGRRLKLTTMMVMDTRKMMKKLIFKLCVTSAVLPYSPPLLQKTMT